MSLLIRCDGCGAVTDESVHMGRGWMEVRSRSQLSEFDETRHYCRPCAEARFG